MRHRIEYYKHDYWNFAFEIMNPHDNDSGTQKYCCLRLSAFRHSLWIKLPQLFKPREKWVDLSKESWATPRSDGLKGYTDYIQRCYGFSFDKESLHIHYGIQPGSWSRNDPKNSDHIKVMWWPWRLDIVRHDLLLPNGDLYHRNTYPGKGRQHLHWYEVFDGQVKSDVQIEVAKFVTIEHHTRNGTKQVAKIRLAGEEREWRPKWTKWLPFFKRVERVVYCNSDVELGEKAGSWKGGLMGWSCDWHENETMEAAFRRWYSNWNGV